jgi:hypothetical protein
MKIAAGDRRRDDQSENQRSNPKHRSLDCRRKQTACKQQTATK